MSSNHSHKVSRRRVLRRVGIGQLARPHVRRHRLERFAAAAELHHQDLAAIERAAGRLRVVSIGREDRQDAGRPVGADDIAGDEALRHELQRALDPGRLRWRACRLGLRERRRCNDRGEGCGEETVHGGMFQEAVTGCNQQGAQCCHTGRGKETCSTGQGRQHCRCIFVDPVHTHYSNAPLCTPSGP